MSTHVKKNEAVYSVAIGVSEVVLFFLGFWFTLEAVQQASNANRATSRGQLYATENVISERESDLSGTHLLSIYAHPSDGMTDPELYIRIRLAALGAGDLVMRARSVKELYDIAFGLDSFPPDGPPAQTVVELRRIVTHLGTILTQMHAAYDYRRDGVISTEELVTWLGYAKDIGPHPLFLATLWTWHEARYMSRGFAALVIAELTASERDRAVIHYFYPQMLEPAFLASLPDY